jgi:hypothetical protein
MHFGRVIIKNVFMHSFFQLVIDSTGLNDILPQEIQHPQTKVRSNDSERQRRSDSKQYNNKLYYGI